ncbi:diguanylate cyclase response regulator [Thiomicrorhabdus immobilis]|uniref:diguanylate cyclase n=1 Tax=Thiomicrorhabdus immobilis TaxID=2791037 RepID=A0ABM7MAP9_9GAMM|nr:diguanylate cyclase [Thiomicrorhabdus immobilis]BCN92399.1 diguanylate cyclase response regulator [Thiomicrorhabdus immobilis]
MPQEIILVIEDQKSIAQYLQQRLSEVLPYSVEVAESYAEAKRVINSGVPILVCLSDLNLPDAAEGATVELLRKANITTVVLTASYSEETRQKMLAQRVADYVVKDGASAIDYAISAVVRLAQNSDKCVWLIASGSRSSNRLLGLLNIQRYVVKVFDDFKSALKKLEGGAVPELLMLEGAEKIKGGDVLAFIANVRSSYSVNQLPIMVCETSENVSLAIKLMKYGVNDFYNLSLSAEELFVRLNQNIDQTHSYKEIERISRTDALTNLYNRRCFFYFGESYFKQLQQLNTPFFVVMVDIDHFKKVNDTYGHQKGDEAIVFTAGALAKLFSGFTIARFGGEEFCVLGEAKDKASILKVCEDFRQEVEIFSKFQTDVGFTVSVGVSFKGENLEQAINFADSALYLAKESGRNQVQEYK